MLKNLRERIQLVSAIHSQKAWSILFSILVSITAISFSASASTILVATSTRSANPSISEPCFGYHPRTGPLVNVYPENCIPVKAAARVELVGQDGRTLILNNVIHGGRLGYARVPTGALEKTSLVRENVPTKDLSASVGLEIQFQKNSILWYPSLSALNAKAPTARFSTLVIEAGPMAGPHQEITLFNGAQGKYALNYHAQSLEAFRSRILRKGNLVKIWPLTLSRLESTKVLVAFLLRARFLSLRATFNTVNANSATEILRCLGLRNPSPVLPHKLPEVLTELQLIKR